MAFDAQQKVTASHLKRDAYLYIRQSTVRQVFENQESTKRQYALRQRAVAMGWETERVVVIDSDLGQSGAQTVDRQGFQRLVGDVGMGKAGIVMGLEVSRLARNSTDWHRLLEICALTDTLILDEDGIYDPAHFNDRLLLGLKGTMSEAELHVLHARLRGGFLNKARRGELCLPLPVGLVYDAHGAPMLDPDRQVQDSIRLIFTTFRRTGSACATVKYFREQGLKFPYRGSKGFSTEHLAWIDLAHSRALQTLHNPRYAGAYVFGRSRTIKRVSGVSHELVPREQWQVLLQDAHPGYISWQEYECNQQRLRENAQMHAGERKSPPREGAALLQGLVICGRCGGRMTVRYPSRKGYVVPAYMCQNEGIERAERVCQSILGVNIDAAIGRLTLDTLTPMALEVALSVQQELQARQEEVDRVHYQQVERARFEAELAKRRYMRVDPDNRLVADSLEAEWNEKLRQVNQAQEDYEHQRQVTQIELSEQQKAEITALANDFPRLWNSPQTPQRERKRMMRLLIEDVTLCDGEEITAHVRFKGGTVTTLQLPRPKTAWELHTTPPDVVAEIDRLLDKHTDLEIVPLLNAQGMLTGKEHEFDVTAVQRIRRAYGLKNRFERLREKGLLTMQELAEKLHVTTKTVKDWKNGGLILGYHYNDKLECLYEPSGAYPVKWKRKYSVSKPQTALCVESLV
jgi:DNA invertase Pin-like site-specific DNA recombinase/DNA-binding XRE family transcriptional regulator